MTYIMRIVACLLSLAILPLSVHRVKQIYERTREEGPSPSAGRKRGT
ncbi:MAG: hypothetical protein IPF79_02345 [Ignavibacteria bacterium]|nr:hypothetical protein [Ignavibacteria bacterium]